MTKYSITIARALDLEEIRSTGGFNHTNVIDARRGENGLTRPIEECILKRLKNHFIGYEQLKTDDAREEDELLIGMATSNTGDTLVLTDDVSHVASLCQNNDIPFKSKAFYVVETGKGDFVHSVAEKPEFQPRFGTFVG